MRRIVRLVWLIATGLVLSRPVALGEILYVNNTGPADHVTIQAAIDDALDGDVVLVAPGTYTGDGNRDIDFLGKAITVRSQDGPETCIIDCQGSEAEPHRGFYFHSGEDANSILEGVSIINGYTHDGAGIWCYEASPRIVRCMVLGNVAIFAGGGVFASRSSSLIANCVVSGNEAGGDGGGIYCEGNLGTTIRSCTITENRAGTRGHLNDSGGGIAVGMGQGEVHVHDTILWGNSAPHGTQLAQVQCGSVLDCMEVAVQYCCIESGPNSAVIARYGPPIEGVFESNHNISEDPLLVNAGSGDYHLRSQAGRWDPQIASWVYDDVTSPCIDAGDPNSSVGDEPFPHGGIVNMGAYGGTAEASKSYDDRVQTLHVDDDGTADYVTIQAAIDDACDGDIVLVAPGTYTGDGNRDIDFLGKAITVRSEDGPETCIIDCGGKPHVEGLPTRQQANPPLEYHRGFYFLAGEDANSILQGFTITGGYLRGDRGAGIYCYEASPQIVDCIVTGNIADRGGGVSLVGGTPTLNHCLITGNNVGGITAGDSDFVLRNCTISGNRPDGSRGGGLYCDSGFNTATLHNCILWGNENRDGNGSEIYLGAGVLPRIHLELNHCVVQDRDDFVMDEVYGTWTSADPCFVQPGYWEANETGRRPYSESWINGDYHLRSQAGRWAPQTASWVYDDVTSPCIDAGDPNSPVGAEPVPNGGIVNLGAYGGTAEASKSHFD